MQQTPDNSSTTQNSKLRTRNSELGSWEDLDPEPPRRERFGQWRELILGLVLVLVVVGWAGWQWLSQAHVESEYNLGQQALAANQLDEAEAHFAGISDYKDAGKQAQDIAREIAQRNNLYQQVTEDANSQNWLAAYVEAQQVTSIQPGYRDTQSIADQSEEHIYTEALSDTVVSRPDASPAGYSYHNGDNLVPWPGGLYYRQGDKWIWLQYSDAVSQVRGIGPPGHLVYDVPGTPQPRRANSDPTLALQGSRLMLATITPDGVSFDQLSLDPAQFDFFIWGDYGVWGLKSQIDDASRPNFVGRPSYSGYNIIYEAFGSTVLSPMLPKGSGWSIMDLAPDGKHILLSDVGGYSSTNPVTQLYVADADGSNLHFVYTYIGGFFRALFSPNSQYLVVNTFFHLGFDTPIETQAVTLIDVSGQNEPIVLDQTDVEIDNTTYGHPVFSTSFVQSGRYQGDVLMVQWGKTGTSISVIDPNLLIGHVVHSWTIPGDNRPDQATWSGEVQNQDGLLLVFQSTPTTGSPYLNVAWDTSSFGGNGSIGDPSPLFDWTAINLSEGEKLQRAWMSDGYFVYVTSQDGTDGGAPVNFTLYSRKLPFNSPDSNVSSTPTTPITTTTTTHQLFDSLVDPGLDYQGVVQQLNKLIGGRSVAIGSGLLARGDHAGYGAAQIQVKSYDGTLTANLPGTQFSLYDWSEFAVYRGLR